MKFYYNEKIRDRIETRNPQTIFKAANILLNIDKPSLGIITRPIFENRNDTTNPENNKKVFKNPSNQFTKQQNKNYNNQQNKNKNKNIRDLNVKKLEEDEKN